MVEIFPSMMKTTNPQIQKSQQTPNRRTILKSAYVYLNISQAKKKRKFIRAAREKTHIHTHIYACTHRTSTQPD